MSTNLRNIKRTAVNEMHQNVYNTEDTDQHPCHFVKIYMVIQRYDGVEAVRSQECDALAQHQDQDECTVKIQTLA